MIRIIHKYNRSIAIVFLMIAFCFAMSGVGIDVLHDGSSAQRPAIIVNSRSFSEAEFARAVDNNEESYRKRFGDQFDQYAKIFGINVAQQTIDQMVDTALLNQEAAGMGFAADQESVKRVILENVFNGMPYDEVRFRGLLKASNLTYRDFEREVMEEQARNALVSVLRDSAYVSKRDIERKIMQQETAYAVQAALINTAEVAASAPSPSEEQLKAFYDQNAARFEVPPQVSYSYIELAPSSFAKDVQVSEDDIGIYYTENAKDFSIPEQVRIREIRVLYPKSADEKAKADAREKAKQAREEAIAGKEFSALVAKYATDPALKSSGGDRGWISRGSQAPAFDKAAFTTELGSVSEIVETEDGVSIIKVEESKPSSLKPLSDVKAQIDASIRASEAPSYAKAKGEDLLKAARRDNKSLSEVAGLSSLQLKESGAALSAGKDPSAAPSGITDKVLALPSGDRLSVALIEVGDTTALVQVKEFKDASIAPFAEVRGKILEALKAQEVQKLAEQRAQEIITASQAAPQAFAAEAQKRGAKVVGPVKLSRANPSSAELPDLSQPMASAIFSATSPQVIARPFPSKSGFIVASVTAIDKPDLSKGIKAEDLEKYRLQAQEEASRDAVESALAYLKSTSTIDVDPALMARQ